MSAEPFARMTPSHRAFAIETVRRKLYELSAKAGHSLAEDSPLSTSTAAWLRRLETALVDQDCSSLSYRQMDDAAFGSIPAAEADELRRRLDEFVQLRDVYPLEALSPEQALQPVLEEFLRRAEAREAVTR
jgi:hypothetical protein